MPLHRPARARPVALLRRPVPWLAPVRALALAAVATAVLATALPEPAPAYLPSLEDLYADVARRDPAIRRAVLETRTYVFDPLHRTVSSGDPHPDAVPPELPGRSFRQKIYWIRNAFLGIETLADDGTPLNFYLHEGFAPVQGNLTPSRSFSEADVVHPFLPFLTADAARWRQAMEFWGLNPQGVELARGPKGKPLYRLYEEGGASLWLDPETLRPVRLRTTMLGPNPQGRTLTIEFSEFMFIGERDRDEENLTFPRTVSFLLDGKLFKQTVLLRFEADPSTRNFPITRLRQEAAKVQSPRPISILPTAGGDR